MNPSEKASRENDGKRYGREVSRQKRPDRYYQSNSRVPRLNSTRVSGEETQEITSNESKESRERTNDRRCVASECNSRKEEEQEEAETEDGRTGIEGEDRRLVR